MNKKTKMDEETKKILKDLVNKVIPIEGELEERIDNILNDD